MVGITSGNANKLFTEIEKKSVHALYNLRHAGSADQKKGDYLYFKIVPWVLSNTCILRRCVI